MGLIDKLYNKGSVGSRQPTTLKGHMNEPTSLISTQVKNLCKIGKGPKTCSFLGMGAGAVWRCLKGSELEATIIERRSSMGAKGDNCSGPPDFKPNADPIAKTLANKSKGQTVYHGRN